jgi:hypothetical protein
MAATLARGTVLELQAFRDLEPKKTNHVNKLSVILVAFASRYSASPLRRGED